MKHLLLFLLFCTICNAQQEFKNFTKVTAYRLVNEDEGGFCNIKQYANRLKHTGYYIQAMQSYNDTLAYNLIQLKKEALKWNKEKCNCTPTTSGGAIVTNMFVVEINNYRDTLFTTKSNKAAFFPKEQALYIAPENLITSAFTKEIVDFYKRDFSTEINDWKQDSIPARDLTIGKKSIYGLTRKEFEKDITLFQVSRTDSVFEPNGKLFNKVSEYWLDNMKFNFRGISDQISEVLITNYTSYELPDIYALDIDGIKIGDPEEMLYCKYDNSTLIKYWDAPLNEINHNYTYEVILNNLEGKVRYTIKDKIIQVIHIEFMYPNGPRKKKKK